MARPTKQGVDYFPLDVYMDDKVKFIEIKYKLEGFSIVVKLLQRIYSQGYWCKWSDDEALLFSDELRTSFELIQNVVMECVDRNFFSKELYYQHGILTSKGIQKRYKEIVRRRTDVEMQTDYLVIDGNFGVIDGNNQDNDGRQTADRRHNDGKSTQSKVNKTKSNNKEIDVFFESLWVLYPEKKGKGQISATKKETLYKLGFDVLSRCIGRYKDSKETWQNYQNGSTFFNSGYVDYIDANYNMPKEKNIFESGVMLEGGGVML